MIVNKRAISASAKSDKRNEKNNEKKRKKSEKCPCGQRIMASRRDT